MAISAKQVKKLREMTGVGMMDCKKALQEADGDFDEAVELLRKKGQKVAAKRADREASEGLVVSRRNEAGNTGVLVEVNCETDFVARNDEFSEFVAHIAELILEHQPSDHDELEALPFEDGKSVEEAILEMTGKIGEKIEVSRFEVLSSNGGKIISYIHPGSRLGVLVDIKSDEDVEDVGRDVAMQVAALNPVAAHVEEVPEEIKQKEREIARESAVNEGKPEHVIEHIVEGKLKRYYKDHVLVEQPFVKDSSVTVKEMLKQHSASVNSYTRFALGEE